MAFEYCVWAKTPLWAGENDDRAFPRMPLDPEVRRALTTATAPPPYRGGTPKEYANRLHRLFLDYGNKLLSPANCLSVAGWLREWATAPDSPHIALREGLRTAAWLERAASDGWYVDWSDS